MTHTNGAKRVRSPQTNVTKDKDDRAELLCNAEVSAIDARGHAEFRQNEVRAEEHEEGGEGVDEALREEHAAAPERRLRAVHWRESGVELEIQMFSIQGRDINIHTAVQRVRSVGVGGVASNCGRREVSSISLS